MSRIGKKPIEIPEGVTFEINNGEFKVKGPKGEITEYFDPSFKVSQNENELVMERPSEQKKHKALHGLYRSLLNNAIIGVSKGYVKELELVGVGYKATAEGNVLEMGLGYSHSVFFQVPGELKLTAETLKGKNPTIRLEGNDKQLIGHVAAKIKSLRPVEPYKGKGIRFVGEYVRRKAGKTAAK